MELPKRKQIRLKDYDYSQVGYYFITICSKNKEEVFWSSRGDLWSSAEIPLSNIGEIIDAEINKMCSFYENVEINNYVIMPNHIHMIIVLSDETGRSKTAPTVSRIVQQFKGSVTKKVGFPIWQKLFHDHIIRNEQEYRKICEYIENNPLKWAEDKYYFG